MYVFKYSCMYVCVCIYTHTHTCVCVYIYICILFQAGNSQRNCTPQCVEEVIASRSQITPKKGMQRLPFCPERDPTPPHLLPRPQRRSQVRHMLYVLLYMCPHTAIYVSSCCYMCPHTAICVLILLLMCPHAAIYVSSYCNMCPHTAYMCPHTATYVSSYYFSQRRSPPSQTVTPPDPPPLPQRRRPADTKGQDAEME